MDYGALWIGLAIFLVPMAVFGWSVYSEKGRAGYARVVEEQRRLDQGLPPLPPRTALGRWSRAHPWRAVGTASVAVGALMYGIGTWLLDDGPGGATLRALIYGGETFLLGWIHVARDRRGGRN